MDDALAAATEPAPPSTDAADVDRDPDARSRTRRALLVFAVACLAISLGCWVAAAIVAAGAGVRETEAGFVLFAIGTAGPSLAALVAVLVVQRSPSRRVRLRAPWAWLPLAIALPALPAVVVEAVLSPGTFGSHAAEIVASTGGLVLFAASSLVAGPLAEEFGWRGFLQPRLRVRFAPLATAAIVGVGWALWHVPLFFLPGTGQFEVGLATVPGVLFLLSAVPLSVTFLFVSERLGGGVVAAILAHASVNVSLTVLPQTSDAAALLQFALTCLVAVAVVPMLHRVRP